MTSKKKIIGVSIVVFLVVIIFAISKFDLVNRLKSSISSEVPSSEDITQEQSTIEIETESIEESLEEIESSKEENTEEPEIISPEALSDESVMLRDLYAEDNADIRLMAFEKSASSYKWESYDIKTRQWNTIEDTNTGYDEMYRMVSYVDVQASDKAMYRCTVDLSDSDEEVVSTCTIRTVTDIASIKLDDFDFDAESYVNILDLPIHVKYLDDTEEDIYGLYGAYFIENCETTYEYERNEYGALVETAHIVNSLCQTSYVEMGDNEKTIRYLPLGNESDINLTICGKDLLAPIINATNVDFETSSKNQEVEVDFSIDAEDNLTALPFLTYALKIKGRTPSESDYSNEFNFTKKITQNGTYVVYVKDESNNVATKEIELIVVDEKKPVIKNIFVENLESWTQSKKIVVSAEDKSELTYNFFNLQSGTESGFIKDSEHIVFENGDYEITVKDKGGNESKSAIQVSNIDANAPVINKIIEK